MDHQNRPGSKIGTGGVASQEQANVHRRERLRQLALDTIDLARDPYFMKNHLGSYECKLCLTLHTNEGSYLAHTQGRKHQTNLARRAARDARDAPGSGAQAAAPKRRFIKIGRPGYTVTKVRDRETQKLGLLIEVHYPEIAADVVPRRRLMSAYEQRQERPDRAFQYLLVAAEPYETIAFKIDNRPIDQGDGRFWAHWDAASCMYSLLVLFDAR